MGSLDSIILANTWGWFQMADFTAHYESRDEWRGTVFPKVSPNHKTYSQQSVYSFFKQRSNDTDRNFTEFSIHESTLEIVCFKKVRKQPNYKAQSSSL